MRSADDWVAALLETLDRAWRDFQFAYGGLSDGQMQIPGVTGEWSIRDLIAHITWWDEEAIKHLPIVRTGGRPPRYSDTYGGIDAFNALMTERTKHLTLAEVRTAMSATHQRLLDYLQSIPPDEFKANTRFRHRLKLDTYAHYPIHTRDIQVWRSSHGV